MKHTCFYFLRHGQTQWNKDRITQGQLDAQLNETGRRQAQKAAEILKNEPISQIIASPLSRARNTAQAVNRFHGFDIIFEDGLKECHLGDHQGMPHDTWPIADYWTGKHLPPNGESFDIFSNRVWNALQKAIKHGPNTLIVAHGGLWLAAQRFINIRPDLQRLPNALPLKVTPKGVVWEFEVLGANSTIDID